MQKLLLKKSEVYVTYQVINKETKFLKESWFATQKFQIDF